MPLIRAIRVHLWLIKIQPLIYTDFIRNAMSHDSLCDTKGTHGRIACVECNTAELIVMTIYFPLLETRIVLRTVIFGAGMLVVVLAAAGMVSGTEWGV